MCWPICLLCCNLLLYLIVSCFALFYSFGINKVSVLDKLINLLIFYQTLEKDNDVDNNAIQLNV